MEKAEVEDEMLSITDSTDMNLNKLWQIVEDTGAQGATVHGGLVKTVVHTEQLKTNNHHHLTFAFPCAKVLMLLNCGVGEDS